LVAFAEPLRADLNDFDFFYPEVVVRTPSALAESLRAQGSTFVRGLFVCCCFCWGFTDQPLMLVITSV